MPRWLPPFLVALLAVVGLASPVAAATAPVEPDVPLHAVAVTPGDPLYAQQWGLARVRMPEAWQRGTGSPSVVIAVVDTGVDGFHQDLAANLLPGVDCITRPGTCTPETPRDPGGHGTGVAAVIAGVADNGQGVAGHCWSCKILPVRALDGNGDGSALTVSTGIRWAADHGARIINLSLAGDATNSTLDSSISYARGKGAIVVAAAGNQTRAGQNLSGLQYPAASPGVLSVVATDPADIVYPWSFRGSWADVAAPGCVTTAVPGSSYGNECGTSFASPAVAGILGLAMSTFPGAGSASIEADLLSSAVALGPAIASSGRVDAAALEDLLDAQLTPANLPERIAGGDRTGTAVVLSRKAFASAHTVVLARSDSYADALAAAPLAGKLGAPVLLTPSGFLGSDVAAEIRRLGADTAVLVGGSGALSPAVETGLQGNGVNWRRIAGASRYETAALIAREVGGSSVFVTQASAWADAVAVSGLAATLHRPILLVDPGSVPAATAEALAALGASDVTVVGGAGVVSDAVVTALHATRLAGANRYETSRLIAERATAAGASTAWVATGSDWPDALAAGPASAGAGTVLQLVDGHGGVSPVLARGITRVVTVGGEASMTTAVLAALSHLLSGARTRWPWAPPFPSTAAATFAA